MHKQGEKFLFVINPISGGKKKTDWETAIREYFSARDQQLEIYILNGKDDRSSLKKYIQLITPAVVVAVGGDGTVKMLAEIIRDSRIIMGILPAGSANGMARELGIPEEADEALKIIETGLVKNVDAIRINETELCIHLADVGLNAMLVENFEKTSTRGMWGYGKSVIKMLFRKRKMRVTLAMDEQTVKRHAYMVTIANARKYGTGANINPEGDIADGKFEVVVVRKINLLEIFKSIFTNKAFHPRRIEVFSTGRLELSSPRKIFFQVDGEYMGKITQLQARIVPGALKLLLPSEPNDLA